MNEWHKNTYLGLNLLIDGRHYYLSRRYGTLTHSDVTVRQ